MRITSKGQVTIPQALREKTGLLPHTEVEFELAGKSIRIKLARPTSRAGREARIVNRLRAHGRKFKMTTEQIMALTRGE